MSVFIKGLTMPKDCVSCRWHARWGCEITGIVTNAAQGCPLVEIPTPHGRLIDADAILSRYTGNILTAQLDYAEGLRDAAEDMKAAPTIIEAEDE